MPSISWLCLCAFLRGSVLSLQSSSVYFRVYTGSDSSTEVAAMLNKLMLKKWEEKNSARGQFGDVTFVYAMPECLSLRWVVFCTPLFVFTRMTHPFLEHLRKSKHTRDDMDINRFCGLSRRLHRNGGNTKLRHKHMPYLDFCSVLLGVFIPSILIQENWVLDF